MCLQSCSPLCLYALGCSASTPTLDPQGGAGRIIPKGEITGQLLNYTTPAVLGLDAWRPTKPAPGGGPALGGYHILQTPQDNAYWATGVQQGPAWKRSSRKDRCSVRPEWTSPASMLGALQGAFGLKGLAEDASGFSTAVPPLTASKGKPDTVTAGRSGPGQSQRHGKGVTDLFPGQPGTSPQAQTSGAARQQRQAEECPEGQGEGRYVSGDPPWCHPPNHAGWDERSCIHHLAPALLNI